MMVGHELVTSSLSNACVCARRRAACVPLLSAVSKEVFGAAPRAAHTPAASPSHASLAAWSPVALPSATTPSAPAVVPSAPAATATPSDPATPAVTPPAAIATATATLGSSADQPLQLPQHVHYVSDGKLMAYDVVSRTAVPLAVLPGSTGGAGGTTLAVRQVVSSPAGHLVFFEALSQAAGAAPAERWMWSLVLAGASGGAGAMAGSPVWLKPGGCGRCVMCGVPAATSSWCALVV